MIRWGVSTEKTIKKILWLLMASAMFGCHIKLFSMLFCVTFPIVAITYIEKFNAGFWFRKVTIGTKYTYKYSIFFMSLWLIWAVVSLIWAQDTGKALYQLEFLILGFMCAILFFCVITGVEDMLEAIKVICGIAVINNILGWFEIITQRYLFLSNPVKIQLYQAGRMPVALFDNTNDLATYLTFMIFFAILCFCIEKKKVKKFYYLMLAGSSAGLIFYAGSKANMIGLLLGFSVLALYGVKNRKNVKVYLFLSIVLLVLFVMNLDKIDIIINYLREIFTHTYRASGSSYSVRINLILNSFAALRDTFGMGVGIGNSQYYMQNYATYETYGTYALHNFWLEIMVDYGIVIGILFLIFYLGLMHTFLKSVRKHSGTKMYISLGFLACLVSFSIGSLSSSSNMTSIWIWVIFAVFVVFQKLVNYEEKL